MSLEQPKQPVYVNVTQRYAVPQGREPGVVISVRDYDRLIERLAALRSGGWADLWLAGVGFGIALASAALVGALTLPSALSGTRDVLWAITGAGTVFLFLCLFGYLTQRRDHGRDVEELRKDLEIHKPKVDLSPGFRLGKPWLVVQIKL
jgi:hypothetical protein